MLAILGTSLSFAPPDLEQLASLEALAPNLHDVVKRAITEPAALAEELRTSPLAAIAPTFSMPAAGLNNATLPIVVAHGMGDSCFNPGMKSITQAAGARLSVYATCIPTGNNRIFDTINGESGR